MWDFLVNTLAHAYTQVVLLALFIWYFYALRQDPRLKVSRLGLVRLIILTSIFLYFLLSWSSGIRPALAQAAVLGMFLINLLLLFNLVLTRLEGPYRDALVAYVQESEDQERLDQIWHRGKRFYFLRYSLSALLSGMSPWRFLKEMAGERVRDDLKEAMARQGVTQNFVTLPALVGFLKARLAQDELLPQDYRELITQAIGQFSQHAWIEEQVNAFLAMAVETPENLYHPQWSQMWEKAQQSK